MKTRTIFVILAFLLLMQSGLIAFGGYQIRQPDSLTQAVGVFNIAVNAVFGVLNLSVMAILAWMKVTDNDSRI